MKLKILLYLTIIANTMFAQSKTIKYSLSDNGKQNYILNIIGGNDTSRLNTILKSNKLDLNFAINEPQNNYQATLLGFAVENCKLEIIKILLENGANPNLRVSYDYYKELQVSEHIFLAAKNDTAKMNLLINHGANIKIPEIKQKMLKFMHLNSEYINNYIRKLYSGAVSEDAIYNLVLSNPKKITTQLVEDYLKNGANLAFEGLLFYAIDRGTPFEVIQLFVNKGVNLNEPRHRNYIKELPIFAAIYRDNLAVVKVLVEKGVNLSVVGYHNSHAFSETPLNYAIRLNKTEISDYLFSKGSK